MRTYVLIKELLPLVFRDCPHVPQQVALHELRQAAIRFCTKTRFWREDVVPLQTLTSTATTEYEVFCLAPDTRPVATISLQADGRPLEPRTEDELDRNESNWRAKEGQPTQFVSPSAAWVRPIPISTSKAVTLTGKIAVAPTQDGQYLLDDLYQSHGESIAAMAKNTLMLMPGKPWSNPDMAVYFGRLGDDAMSDALATASRNFSAAPKRRVKPHWF